MRLKYNIHFCIYNVNDFINCHNTSNTKKSLKKLTHSYNIDEKLLFMY